MDKLLEKYEFKEIENEIKQLWKKWDVSKSVPNNSKNFTIVIPPPNVTGHLHLGHAWDGIIQDSIIRYKRLQGFNSIWIPGTDHAGIATQVKFEKYLSEQGINKNDLGRNNFLLEINKWKDSQANFIHKQWDEMGFMLDYSREKFTLDTDFSVAVLNAFVSLYKAGLIYEDYKLVNWDTKLKTAISDIEVIHEETNSKFYYINYDLVDENNNIINDKLLIATTRPETMFGDVCIVIHPEDNRYNKYLKYKAINPANNQQLPIIADEYVDKEFGTGVMKCTPGHDFNDYNLAKKHHLKIINIMNDDGTLNNNVPEEFVNKDMLLARKLLVDKLEKSGHLDHIENIVNSIGYSERTKVIVQPYLTKQWFLKTSELAKDVIKTQNSTSKVIFLPERFENNLMHWLLNMEDWCISRQLWWGHQLPIWYNKKTNKIYCEITPPKDEENWFRSTDVLDTWFSSGLWPLIALNWNGKNKIDKLFPTQLLVTGYDIIFFWIARMMMFSSYFMHTSPFNYVYIHGLVKDEKNRKMSKSLGNGIEPKTLIDNYGNDALRIFFLSDSTAGQDISFKEAKLKQSFNFLIKIWNTAKFIEYKQFIFNKDFEINENKNNSIENWMLNKLEETSKIAKENLDKYNFNIAFKYLSDFVWDDFSNFYLECLKKENFNNEYSINIFLYIWKYILIMLQPFAPFISEYLFNKQFNNVSSILKEEWINKTFNIQKRETSSVETGIELLRKIRNLRNDLNFSLTEEIIVEIENSSEIDINTINNVLSLANTKILIDKEEIKNKTNNGNYDGVIIPIANNNFSVIIPESSFNKYRNKLKAEINRLLNEVERSTKILSNKNFKEKASKEKIKIEDDKLNKYKSELEELQKEESRLRPSSFRR